MAKQQSSESTYTASIKLLLSKIHNKSPLNDSVYERAISYFDNFEEVNEKKEFFKNKIAQLQAKIELSADKKEQLKLESTLSDTEKKLSLFNREIDSERVSRHNQLLEICNQIINLCESDTGNWAETCNKTAKLLGTIQLVSHTEGQKVAIVNEKHKHLYKAVLSLRLLDQMYLDGNIDSKYILACIDGKTDIDFTQLLQDNADYYKTVKERVKVPLLMAAIIQDIGNFHPDARAILEGEDKQLDPFRTLDIEGRKALLQISYRETLRYITSGIGVGAYIGNSKAEREEFLKIEKDKLAFIRLLLKSYVNPKNGIGNLLKIPQIYTSIVLSTKSNYKYQLLPMVFQVLNQNAERGICNQKVVDSLYKITGDFPQGYGITYIPKDSDGKDLERYEYAVVNGLYPEKANEPKCRVATRNLTFISHGSDIVINKASNLYYKETAKRLAKVSKERLNEILQLLASNYQDRKDLDLLPRSWHAREFFSNKKYQKLWNKSQ